MHRKVTVIIGALAIGVTLVGGVALASGASKSVKACATSKGDLRLASSKGRCPKGTKKVTIAKQGPAGKRGRAGISHLYTNLTTGTGSAVAQSSGSSSPFTPVNTIAQAPAGQYLVAFQVELANSGSSAIDVARCEITTGSTSQDLVHVTEPSASGLLTGFFEVTGTTSVTLASAGSIVTDCIANNGTTLVSNGGGDSLTAAAVGAVN
jgi:hypothetical protein